MILTDIKTHASAFGVAACVGLLFYLLLPNGNDQNNTEQQMVSPPRIVQESANDSLTPFEIIDKLNAAATPSLREKAAQGYVGREAKWNLYLNTIINQTENDVHVVFTDTMGPPHNRFVTCVISLHGSTNLKTIAEGMAVNVSGQISKIDPDNDAIELENGVLRTSTP